MIDAMATSDAGAIILGAVIGAGSALITQVIAIIAEARRERKRVKHEQERFNRELELRKDERFLDIRQDLFSRLSLLASDLMTYIYYPIKSVASPDRQPAPPPDLEEIGRVQSNIMMIVDPERNREISLAIIKLLDASNTAYKDGVSVEDKKREADDACADWWIAQARMRLDLSGGKEYFTQAKDIVLPPDPRPAHLLPWWRRVLKGMKGDG